jgi:4-amino-4-deoxy-L-arabinose transferase-like glycosyltransferase
MDVLAYLKPENGPVGKVFGAWLDHEASGRTTRLLIFVFVGALAGFALISNAPLGPPTEFLDTYARALHPAPGYVGAAPLAALIASVWFLVAPPIDGAVYLLAAVNAGFALVAVDLIARRFVAGDKRILVLLLLLLLLTPFYFVYGENFDSDRTLLWAWPLATLGFLRAYETRSPAWSAFAGAAAGLALLGGYQSIFLLAGFATGVAIDPQRWDYLRSRSPLISAIVAAVVLAPHIYWLHQHGFAPLNDVVAQHTGAPFGEVLGGVASYVGYGMAGVVFPLVLYGLAVRPGGATLRDTLWPEEPEGRLLVVLFITPLALRAVLALLAGTVLTADGTAPAWFLLPIVLLRPAAAQITRTATIRIAALVLVLAIGSLIAAPWLASRLHREGTAEGREHYRQVSLEVTRAWHTSIVRLLRIVMGDPHLTAAIAFLSPDRPDPVPDFDLQRTPFVSRDRLDGDGYVAICRAEDTACVEEARRLANGKTGTQFINFQTRNLYQGTPGKLGRFFIILVPPQPVVQVPR